MKQAFFNEVEMISNGGSWLDDIMFADSERLDVCPQDLFEFQGHSLVGLG